MKLAAVATARRLRRGFSEMVWQLQFVRCDNWRGLFPLGGMISNGVNK